MGKIRLFIASSLDGYIADQKGDVNWLFTDDDYGYSEFFNQVDTLIMGHKTYQQILDFGEYPYRGKKGFVFSTRLHGTQDKYVTFIGENLTDFVHSLRQGNGGDIWLVGGSQVINFFLEHSLLDEIILAIHPLILGDGIPLFDHNFTIRKNLKLKDIKSYDSGLLQVYYDVQ